MANSKSDLEEGCLEAESSTSVQDTHSLKSGSSDDTSLRSRTSLKQHLQQYLRSTPCQVRCKLHQGLEQHGFIALIVDCRDGINTDCSLCSSFIREIVTIMESSHSEISF